MATTARIPRQSMFHGLAFAAIAITALCLLPHVELKLRRLSTRGRDTAGERYFLPPPSALRALSIGYNEVLADLLWIRTIAYFATHLTTDRDFTHLEKHIKNITALDAHFRAPYVYGSSMIMSRGHRLTNAHVLTAIRLLKTGARLFPNEYRFAFHIGAYYINDLRTPNKKLKRKWRLMGADWIRRAALLGDDVPWLPNLAASIYSKHGQRDLAIRQLKELYLVSTNSEMREQIAKKLAHLTRGQDIGLEQLKAKARQVRLEHQEGPFDFVPQDLYILLREPTFE